MADQTKIVDGKTVIIPDPDEGRRGLVFKLSDLFRYRFIDGGGSAEVVESGQYVPQVDDLAYNVPLGDWFVARVDPATYVADLKRRNANPAVGVDLTTDLYLSTGSGYASESWRLYLNTTKLPYPANIDAGFRTYQAAAKWMRIFEGSDTSANGTIISRTYDQTGVMGSDLIPLDLAGTYEVDGISVEVPVNNISIKAPPSFYLTKKLKNGDVVTAVFYSEDDLPLKVAVMLVHVTDGMALPSGSVKRIRGIELVSPWLSSTEPNTLVAPLNVTISTVGMYGRVIYTDGSSKTLPVGGDRGTGQFKLLNLDYWSPNVEGSKTELKLTYMPSPNEEYAYPEGDPANGVVSKDYTIRAERVRDTYNLKMYVFPTYSSGTQGYTLEAWMYDMSRSIGRRVPTAALKVVEGFPSFNGFDYSTIQHLRLSVDMDKLDASYGSYKHVQNVQIALLRDGIQPPTNWRVKESSDQAFWFGDDLEAKVWPNAGNPLYSYMNVASGYNDLDSWLDAVYYRLNPLYDRATESRAPRPTHFYVTTKTREILVPIENWSGNHFLVNDITNGGTVYIKWIARLTDRELQLGVTGLPLKYST